MHNQPLRSRDFVPLPMARTILECYLEARKEGLPVIQSKRWGIYAAEAYRFGGYINNDRLKSRRREKTVWYNGTSKHAKTKDFDRIIKNTLGTTQFFGKPVTIDNWMSSALKRHHKELWADLQQAAKNYKNIVGISPSLLHPRFLSIYRKWLKVRKGRKLFVEGFGKFDIAAAVKRLIDEYGVTSNYVFLPMEVTAAGYGIHRWRFQSLLKNPILRGYYLKYRSFWSQNGNRLDELWSMSAEQWIKDDPDIQPETLLRRLTAERERQQADIQQRYYGIGNSTEPFAHLTAAPEIQTPHGVLRPVKSPQELREVALAMKNCATQYVPSIRKKSTILLALFDESGQPIALGEVHYDTEAKRWVWGQRLGPENEKLAENIREVFQEYPLAASGVWEHHQDLIGD